MMIEWLHSQQAEAIGWMLLHSLWELSAIAAAIAGILLMLRRRSSNLRYAVACVGMAMMVAATVATYCHLLPAPQVHMATSPSLVNTSPSVMPDDPPPTISFDHPILIEHEIITVKAPLTARLKALVEPALPYATAFYLIGAFLLALRMLAGYGRMQVLTRSALAAGSAAQSMLAELTQRLGVTRSIRLLESAAVEVPTMLGLLKPVILLPASALTGLSPDQLLALLAHEIAHIRRHDYAANLLQSVIETLLFYHPATWWLSTRIRQERENCCDDLAVSITGDRLEYARALASMEALRTAPTFVPPHLALTARSGVLLPRIRRLLGVPSHRRTLLPAAALLLLLLLGGIVYLLATATNPPPPQIAPVTAAPAATPSGTRQTTLDGMLVIIPTKLLEDANIHWDQNLAAQMKEGAAADAPMRSVQLKTSSDKSALAQLQAKTKGDKRVEMKPLPLATLLEGQTTRISAGDQIMYIKGLRRPQLSATQPSTPEMATLDTGLKLDLVSTFVPQATNLDIHSSYVRLDGMDTFETPATPGGPPASIVQVPKTSTAEFTASAALADGGTLMIAGPTFKGEREVETGTPLLSQIPGVGRMFTNRSFVSEEMTLVYVLRSISAVVASPTTAPAAAVNIPESGTSPAGGQNTVSPNGPKPPILAKFVVAAVDESALPENLRALKENETATVPLEKNATDTLKDLLAHGKVELLSRPYLMLNDKEEGSILTGQEGRNGQVRDFPTGYHQKDPADPASEWIAEEADEDSLTRGIKLVVTASVGPKPDMRLKLDLHIMRIIKVERSPAPNVPAEKHLEIFKPIFEDTGMTASLTTESGKSVMIVGPLYAGEPVVTTAAADPAKIDPKRRRLVLIVTPRLPVDPGLPPPTTQAESDRTLNDERQRQVAGLVADAHRLSDNFQFKEAADLLRQAMVIDPQDEDAKLFLSLVEDKKNSDYSNDLARHNATENIPKNNVPAKDLIPYADLMIQPDNWLEVTRKGGDDQNGGQDSTANRLANERLDQPLKEIVADKQSLEKVINFLRDNTNTNIFVNWKALEAAGVDRNAPVSLNLHNTPLRKALTTMLAEVGGAKTHLGCTIDDGIITISTKDDLESEKYQLIRVYDIRDLLIMPADRSSPFTSADDSSKKAENTKEDPANVRAQLVKNVEDTIKSTVEPDSWRENGGKVGSIRELNGQLIVNQTADNQRDIVKLIMQLREAQSLQIAFEAKLVVVDDDILASLPQPQTQPAPVTTAATQPTGKIIQLDDKQLDALFKKIEASPTSSTFTAPRANLYNGQRGFVAVTNQQNYVAGCKAKPDKDGKLVPDLEIQTLTFGTTLDVKATVSKDRSQVAMDLKPTIRHLVRMEMLPAPGTPASPEFFIQKPIVEEATMPTLCSLPSGKAAVITGMEVPGDILETSLATDPKNPTMTNKKRSLILIVRPTIIIHREIEADQIGPENVPQVIIHREIENDLFGPGYNDATSKPVQEFEKPTGLPGNPSSQPK